MTPKGRVEKMDGTGDTGISGALGHRDKRITPPGAANRFGRRVNL
jgi:hypothetical protein